MVEKKDFKRKVLKHLGKVGLAILSLTLMAPPVVAIDPVEAANQAVASESGKEALNTALKLAKSKPALSTAAAITCIACIPAAGIAASLGLCIACGILIAKTLG